MFYFEDIKDKVEEYSKMPLKYKKEKLEHIQLEDLPEGYKLKNEKMVEFLQNDIDQFPFLYENR